jgi:hypothetical protein
MNTAVRKDFEKAHGFDPAALFDTANPRHHSRDAAALRTFLDWRSDLARRLQEHWIGDMERIRKRKPDLGLVLTHVDDRYDTRMKDLVGADAARLLPLLNQRDFTFLVEDPATVWHLGPERYTDIAAKYRPITPRPQKLAIDINVVERYQDVYPTKQQTGTELFRLVHLASKAFPRVALYFENSLLPVDTPWLASAAAVPDRVDRVGGKLVIESPKEIGIPWQGSATVNGLPWAQLDGETLWLPAGKHAIEPRAGQAPLRLLDISAAIRTVASSPEGLDIAYHSDSSAWAIIDRKPKTMHLDGEPLFTFVRPIENGRWLIRLPRGQHLWQVTGLL